MPVSLYISACLNTNKPLLKYMYGFVVKFTSYNLPAIYPHTDSKAGPPLHLRILSINPKTLQPPCPPSTSVPHFYFPKWAIAIFHKYQNKKEKENHLNHASGHMVRPAFEQCQKRDLLTPHAGSRRMCAAQHAAPHAARRNVVVGAATEVDKFARKTSTESSKYPWPLRT